MGSENLLALVGASVELQRLRGEPDPGRRPRLLVGDRPVIDLLVAHGIHLIENGLIALPLRLEFAPELLSEFDAPSPA